MDFSFTRYLAAKKTVDDRALNQRVWAALQNRLAENQHEGRLAVLEVGAGIGTMIERALERGLISRALYHAVDSQAENTSAAASRLSNWARRTGWQVQRTAGGMDLKKSASEIGVVLDTADVFGFLSEISGSVFDLLIANAFLDLFDIPLILPVLRSCLKPGGLAYFSINFDGMTVFEPVIDRELEDRIITTYHHTMDERMTGGKPSGDSQAGRHLFQALPRAGFEILEAGSSDWIVFPQNGNYPDDEGYFLRHILHFFEESLHNRPEVTSTELETWLKQHRLEIEQGRLVYIAQQIDFLAAAVETG
jgi:SAM-dependent methyltransferase